MKPTVTLLNQAISLHRQGKIPEAEIIYKKILDVDPKDFDALHMLGIIHAQRAQYDEAERLLHRALSLDRTVPQCLHNYGTVLAKLMRFDDAISNYRAAIKLAPNHAPIHADCGNAYFALNRYDESLAAYDRALLLNPGLPDAANGRGNALFKLRRHDHALAAFDKALALDRNLANAWLGRGNVLYELKRFDGAFAAYDKALVLNRNMDSAEGARLLCKMHLCDWHNFADEFDHLMSSVKSAKVITSPFVLVGISPSPEDHLDNAKLWTAKTHPAADQSTWRGDVYTHNRIRIAYVSADFHEHATSFLMAGMFELHDKSKFELTAISIGPDDGSEMRRRIEACFEKFIDARTLSDDEIAALIRKAEIDILIDLKGFTQDARTDIFSRRPAPIQVNYLGYPGTMGADYIDYLIGDRTLIPQSDTAYYAEKIVYLPNSYQVNDTKRPVPSDQVFTRADCGLPEKGFVFCCFNNNYKIVPSVFDCWMRVLKQVERSVLWLFEDNLIAASNLRREAAARGIDPGRLVFARRMPLSDHLARYRLADLFLDTLPYNAHTTASDALWTGLPVLTQIGETFAGRVAASLLNAVGLPDLITQTREQYEKTAVELASKPERLAAIRARLERDRLAMPLFNTPLFTRQIESAYEAMYRRHHQGLPPDHIFVPR